jgi:triacylglycerol lipase
MMSDPLAPTWDNVFYPPFLNEYTYFRQALTAANTKGWMADAAVLAYARSRSELMNQATFRGIFIQAGFEDSKLITRSDLLRSTQMYFAHRPELAILAFCGTVKGNLKNLLTDFDALPVNPGDPGGTMVHKGFSEALDIVWTDALQLLEDYRHEHPASPLYFTGHSLGGALATLALWRFQRELTDQNVSLHTIGCPRAGNQRFCDELIARTTRGIFRYMDGNDLVTHVPPATMDYAHPGDGFHVGARQWQLSDEVRTVLEDADAIAWNIVTEGDPPEDLADHSPSRYLYYLWK